MREEMQRAVRRGVEPQYGRPLSRFGLLCPATGERAGLASRAAAALLIVFVSGTAAHAQPTLDDWNRALAGAALVTHAADAISTARATETGIAVEANPIVRPFVGGANPDRLKYFGLKFGTAYGSYLLKDWLREKEPKWTLVANVAEIAAFSFIGIHNYRVHQRAQGK